ncbi:hypothetical protein OL239_05520 [Arthrobacter sp. ATA002]|uniref:hypothetical protein n=1 Tax=Arthrobacter sp. ATA002 TaxID=2991715 RepID=UPI0022A7FD70|nr:hypothetical protein [Arthrobacter sp. ATA002]WAP52674.1 hypothetical protein OL239_05520 [Arthrobacter sp. ATA002]
MEGRTIAENRQLPPSGPNRILADAAASAARVFGRWPWYAQVLVVWALARLFSFALFLAVAAQQGLNPWGWEGTPSYLQFIGAWDSEWYGKIFSGGYPAEIPRDANGRALENEWAFYALFPGLVRALAAVTGLGWEVLAPIVATAAGFGAALMVYRLFALRAAAGTALWGVVFVAVSPVSPVLQVPYAESLNLLLLAAALYLLLTRRYLAAVPVVLLMCLSRPVGVAFALMMGILFVRRWVRRRTEPFPAPEVRRMVVLGIASGAGALAWPVAAWAATGDLRAYTDTETAWRGDSLLLFKPWFDEAERLFGPVLGPAALAGLVLLTVLCLNSGPVRRLGVELQVWCAAYLMYLFAFLNPLTSTFRLLLPLFPLGLALAYLSTSRAYRWTAAAAFLILQIVWVAWLWRWTPLPGGGDYPP